MTKFYLPQTPGTLLLLTFFIPSISQCMEQRELDNQRLVVAAQSGDVDAIRFLLAPRAHINTVITQTENGKTQKFTPLRQAVKDNHLEAIQLLLDNKADPNLTTDYSPLYIASANNHPQAAQMLLRAKADPDATNEKGVTSLMLEAQKGNLLAVKNLLDANADTNRQTRETSKGLPVTALTLALRNETCEVVDLLVKAKADVDTPGTQSFPPLHVAVMLGRAQAVQTLVAAGARQDVVDIEGHQVSFYARTDEMKRLLKGERLSAHESKKD